MSVDVCCTLKEWSTRENKANTQRKEIVTSLKIKKMV